MLPMAAARSSSGGVTNPKGKGQFGFFHVGYWMGVHLALADSQGVETAIFGGCPFHLKALAIFASAVAAKEIIQ